MAETYYFAFKLSIVVLRVSSIISAILFVGHKRIIKPYQIPSPTAIVPIVRKVVI